MKAIILDIDGTLIESVSVDTELYFSSIADILGPVSFRDLSDYDNVTDSGILAQVIEDNGHSHDPEVTDLVKAAFINKLRRHIDNIGPFLAIDGAVDFVEKARKSGEYQVAIATGGWRASSLIKLAGSGFEIDGIPLATSDDSPSRIEIMRSALNKLGDDVTSVTYFGDGEWDRRACAHLGWNFVAVGSSLGGIESFAKIGL